MRHFDAIDWLVTILLVIIFSAMGAAVYLDIRFDNRVKRAAAGTYDLTSAEVRDLLESGNYEKIIRLHPSLLERYPQLVVRIPDWQHGGQSVGISEKTAARTPNLSLSDGRTVPVMVAIPVGTDISSVAVMPDVVEKPAR